MIKISSFYISLQDNVHLISPLQYTQPSYAHLKKRGKKSYGFLLPGDMSVSFPDQETELHASPNANLATE